MEHGTRRLRSWIRWTVLLVWACTALCVLICTQIHVSQVATVKVHARELRFRTGPWDIFDAVDQVQFSISGPAKFNISSIHGGGGVGRQTSNNNNIVTNSAASSCTFYNVRTGPIRLQNEDSVVLLWPKHAREHTLAIRLQEPINGSIFPKTVSGSPPEYLCSGTTRDSPVSGQISDAFDTYFATQGDVQLSYHQTGADALGGNVKITGEVRVSHREPDQPGDETSTLLPDGKNEIVFDNVGRRSFHLNNNDLIRIEPGRDLYLRSLSSSDGIVAEFHGTVRGIQVGAGSDAYRSCMPSVFDVLVARKEYITVMPGIAVGILGFLEAIGLLPRKKQK